MREILMIFSFVYRHQLAGYKYLEHQNGLWIDVESQAFETLQHEKTSKFHRVNILILVM